MKKTVQTICAFLLALIVILPGHALAENTEPLQSGGVLPTGTEDLGTIEIIRGDDIDAYYRDLLEAEKYNYRVLRNIPSAFVAEEYDEYIETAEKAIRGNRLSEKQQKLLDETNSMRQNLTRVRAREDAIWMLWGNTMPRFSPDRNLDFTDCYDNADFKPFLVPFLLEDQQSVKGNLIVVAGGGYSGRNNKTEGYPIADAFNALGYNCYILQRRVAPYAKEDSWMDMQRAIRLVRHNIAAFSLGGENCIAAAGFSGGSATVLGSVASYFGSIQPGETDPSYYPDEIDKLSGDLDVALCIYGPNYTGSRDYTGLVTENENIPPLFLVSGLLDNTGAPRDNLILAESVMDKTLVEYHAFANAPHGFGVGTAGTNAPYWIALADGFIDQVIVAGQASDT